MQRQSYDGLDRKRGEIIEVGDVAESDEGRIRRGAAFVAEVTGVVQDRVNVRQLSQGRLTLLYHRGHRAGKHLGELRGGARASVYRLTGAGGVAYIRGGANVKGGRMIGGGAKIRK